MAQMGDSPYSQEFLAEMRDLLTQARDWMQAGVEVEEQQIIEYIGEENTGIDQHQADDASAVYEQTLALTLRNTLSGTLGEVKDALKTLEEGTYGECERCGQWISEDRLRVLPFADLCIECAQRESRDFEPPRY